MNAMQCEKCMAPRQLRDDGSDRSRERRRRSRSRSRSHSPAKRRE